MLEYILLSGCWYLVVGCWYLVVGRWYLVVGCWYLVVGCWYLVVGCWYLVVCRWYLVVCRWSLVVGIGFQPKLPTTDNRQPTTDNRQPTTYYLLIFYSSTIRPQVLSGRQYLAGVCSSHFLYVLVLSSRQLLPSCP